MFTKFNAVSIKDAIKIFNITGTMMYAVFSLVFITVIVAMRRREGFIIRNIVENQLATYISISYPQYSCYWVYPELFPVPHGNLFYYTNNYLPLAMFVLLGLSVTISRGRRERERYI